jgi:ATP-binding cassette subfamily B multidrug efflux pump
MLVQKVMSVLRSDRMCFVIAHRPSTIRDTRLTLVMESGHIVEQGRNASLLEAGGEYAALYSSMSRAWFPRLMRLAATRQHHWR